MSQNASARVRAFGAIQISSDGGYLALKPDQALVVAALVAAGPEGLSRRQLYSNLYAAGVRKSGEQAAVMRVRRLRERVERELNHGEAVQVHDRFMLNEASCEVDIWDFERACVSDNPDVLFDGIRLWDEPYRDCDDSLDFLTQSRENLRRSYGQALTRASWMIEPDFGVDCLPRVLDYIEFDPFNERLVAGAAGALFRLGQQIEATQLLSGCRQRLRDEFGLNPGAHLDEIELAVLNQDNGRLSSRRPGVARRLQEPVGDDVTTEPLRFVGRALVLSHLSDAVGSVGQGGGRRPGRIQLLVGSAGVGKTTLVRKLLSGLGADGPAVRLGRAYASRVDVGVDGRDVYGPIVQAVPELVPALDSLGDAVEGDQARLRFWQTAHNYLQELAQERPTVVVLEDVHGADSQTLGLLRYLASVARPSELAILLTARNDELVDETRRQVLSSIVDADAVDKIELDALTHEDLRDLVALDHEGESAVVRDRFAAHLWELSQGHALVASVLSRNAAKGLDPTQLPSSVGWEGALASALLDRANDPDLRQLLASAALLAGHGLEFRQADLSLLLGVDEERIEDLLTSAGEADICHYLGAGVWTFDHLLTLGLFSQQLGVLRPVISSRLAGVAGGTASDRVRYLVGAGDLVSSSDAVASLRAAARDLESQLAFDEATSAMNEVLRRLRQDDKQAEGDEEQSAQDLLDVQISLAAYCARTGDFGVAAEHRANAFTLAQAADDQIGMYRVALSGLPSGEYAAGEGDRLEMLLKIDADRLPADEQVHLYRWRLRLARLCDRNDLAVEALDVVSVGQAGEDREAWSELWSEVLTHRSITDGDLVYDEFVDLAADIPSGSAKAGVLFRVALAALTEQRDDALRMAFPRAASEARLHGSPRNRWAIDLMASGLNEAGMSDTGDGSADAETARLSGLRWGISDVYDAWGVQIWANKWFQGRFNEALALLDASQGTTALNVAWRAAEGLAAANVGQVERARSCCQAVVDELRSRPNGNWSPAAAGLLIESAAVLGDPALAQVGEAVLHKRSGRAIVLGIGIAYLGPVDRYLGMAAAVIGSSSANQLLEEAYLQAERTGATVWRDRAALDLEQFG